MGKKIFNKIVSSRVFFIIFSILVATVLWVYVEYNEDTDINDTFEIPVVLLNEDLLHERNLVVSEISNEIVMLKFEGKRSAIQKLRDTRANLYVTVDLANVNSAVPRSFPPNIVYPADVNSRSVTLISSSANLITISFDKLFTKSVPVDGVYTGGTASAEYVAEPLEFSPESITIFGPESIVSTIEKAWVDVKRERISKTIVEDMPIVLLDRGGNEVSQEGLTLSQETIRVTVPVKMVREIPLDISLITGAGATAQNTKYTISPSTVVLSGEPEAFKDFNSILIGSVDLMNFAESKVESFKIIIPNNFTNVSQVTEAVVSVDIMGLEARHFMTTNIQSANVPDGMRETVITQSLDILIRGPQEDIDRIFPSNIRVMVNLAGFKSGTSSVVAKVFVDGFENSGAIGQYKVTVRLTPEDEILPADAE